MRNVLLTGASGVIGTATMEHLRGKGYQVVGATSVDADLRDLRSTRLLVESVGPDAIVHLAARVGGLLGNVRSHGEMFFDNARINMNVIEAARLCGVKKVVAMGSVAVYPDGLALPMKEADLWLGPPHKSEAGYAHAKRSMLAQLESYQQQYGLDFAFALSTNLFGPNDKFDEVGGHVLPSLISKFHRGVAEGGPVSVWGTGTASRDFLFARDAARALGVLLEAGQGVYNVASGSLTTIRSLVDELVAVTGYQGKVNWDATKPDGQAARGYDISRLAALGWSPEAHFRTALQETYDWYSQNFDHARR